MNEFVFSFDLLGQQTGETVTNGPALQFADVVPAAYTYSNLNQEATLDGSTGAFEYDADGNMTKGLTGDGLPFTAEYDAGVVTIKTVGKNQHGKVVCEFERTMLIPKRGYDVEEKAGY